MGNKKKSYPKPPKLAIWLLKRFFPDEAGLYTQLGDINEAFIVQAREKSRFGAKAWYWIAILRSIPYSIGRSLAWNSAMFKNYLTIALRNIIRQKAYSFVNILGCMPPRRKQARYLPPLPFWLYFYPASGFSAFPPLWPCSAPKK